MKSALLIPTIGCILAASLLRIFTWNSPNPAWAAGLREVFMVAALVGVFFFRGFGGFYSPRALARRGRSSLIIGVVAGLLFLPPLLYMIYTHWLMPLSAVMNESP